LPELNLLPLPIADRKLTAKRAFNAVLLAEIAVCGLLT